jgi:hypothetical protein
MSIMNHSPYEVQVDHEHHVEGALPLDVEAGLISSIVQERP